MGIIQANSRQIQIENAKFMFRPNFEGRQEKFNNAGDRYFNLLIEPEDVDTMKELGVNVKEYDPVAKNPELDPQEYPIQYFTKVRVFYGFTSPTVAIIDEDRISELDEEIPAEAKSFLTEETVGSLDYMEINQMDMVINRREPHELGKWARLNLKTAYVHVSADPLTKKYGF